MLLTYGDLANLFPKNKGIQDDELFFHTVTTISNVQQYKGIFIPFEENSGALKMAIENGAIAALWKEGEEIPRYTPNHFPIFFTNDLLKGLKDMMELYIEKINQTEIKLNEVTHFLFSREMDLNNNNSTYDNAIIADKISKLLEQLRQGKEGAK
ncbi:hypothetical protein [Cytobacillus dafuensis]|uniref:Uncharacterized protein n=1 Tax=Cytobacillus dafuensis TaxID=1742359 RepID=A0A5B8Z3K5_CYTDA|nr:hypothetical protein [Cytobacillus dafuensis]QED47447.1 hypothetical protein FSZ17_09370 [Cytobacillus dafuensis]